MADREASALSETVSDYRLPAEVEPELYELRLEPDFGAFVFSGRERISVRVTRPVREIVLNAIEIEIDAAELDGGAGRLSGRCLPDPERERVRIEFERVIEPGRWELGLAFRGVLNDKLHGFYRSSYRGRDGETHLVAATQFESTDARRAFPCWDEPDRKARFKTTLVVDPELTAISNTAVESERLLDNGKKEVVFRETIPMSTYLVAFIVGRFEASAPVDAGGVPLRVMHVPGKGGLTRWALEVGAFSLKFFADYYALPYPGDKLDLVAIPDFASGAMENLGAITFRETALLIDAAKAARAELERVADVVSHENAHMWFGDLVTMKWWNGIWLNEAFATFMEMLAVDAWRPDWRRWESFCVSRAGAFAVDALESTRPIEYPVLSPGEARAMFDVLTYEKGAAVLRMLEQYLGAERFRQGIVHYLKRHRFANAETGDLWNALEETSGEPVRRLMDSWIFQPGFPVVEAELTADGRALLMRQRRFFYRAGARGDGALWQVPVMVRAEGQEGAATRRMLLERGEERMEFPAPVKWALVNAGAHGFYRVRYAPALLRALCAARARLSNAERFSLVNDAWAATVAGLSTAAEFVAMARLFKDETDLNVWHALTAPFEYLDMIAGDAVRPALAVAVRELVAPAVERLGWEPRPDEDELTGQLRASLIAALGTLGEDAGVRQRAADYYARYLREPGAVARDLAPALVDILAASGDEQRWREFREAFHRAATPQEEQRYLFALADFRQPALLRRTLELCLSDEVRTQNAPYLLRALLYNTVCRYQAWDFLREHWDEIVRRFPDSALPRMCDGVVALLDREQEVREFLSPRKEKLGAKLIEQQLERLSVAVEFRRREGSRLAAALTPP